MSAALPTFATAPQSLLCVDSPWILTVVMSQSSQSLWPPIRAKSVHVIQRRGTGFLWEL